MAASLLARQLSPRRSRLQAGQRACFLASLIAPPLAAACCCLVLLGANYAVWRASAATACLL
eukprot:6781481-Pyramimonas_sp.AAC.1